jgi:hypothetical protein
VSLTRLATKDGTDLVLRFLGEAWTHLTQSTGIQIVGDDLTVTNPLRIQTYVEYPS